MRCVIADSEHRAISLQQLQTIFHFVASQCQRWDLTLEIMNLYHADAWLIRPATKKENCSMVELLAKEPQKPQWFISHWSLSQLRDESIRGCSGGESH